MINEEEILETVKSFKAYIKIIVSNSSKSFIRKEKARLSREIEYEDYIVSKVSLFNMDNDAFFYDDFKIEYLIDSEIKEKVKVLNDKEKIVLEDMINDIPMIITAKKLNTTVNYIKKLRRMVRNKLKSVLRGENYER